MEVTESKKVNVVVRLSLKEAEILASKLMGYDKSVPKFLYQNGKINSDDQQKLSRFMADLWNELESIVDKQYN